MKTSLFALFVSYASAFAPSTVSQNRASTVTKMAFEDALGSQEPLGFYDPLGLVEDGDQKKFDRLRYVEIKHGRISMLAILGHVTTSAGVRLPGNIDLSGTAFSDIPSGIGALSKIVSGIIKTFDKFQFLLQLINSGWYFSTAAWRRTCSIICFDWFP